MSEEGRKRKERKDESVGYVGKDFFFFLCVCVLHIAAFFKNAAIGYPLKKFIRLDL